MLVLVSVAVGGMMLAIIAPVYGLISQMVDTDSMKKGFTLVDLLLVIGIFALVAGITTVSFFSTVAQTDLGAAQDVLMADLKTKQANAMSGAGDTTWTLATASDLPSGVTLSTSLPSDTLTFAGGTGEIVGFTAGADSLTLSGSSGTKTILLNQYGTIIGK
jgi:type II secretory pathway pseudopilin PulG